MNELDFHKKTMQMISTPLFLYNYKTKQITPLNNFSDKLVHTYLNQLNSGEISICNKIDMICSYLKNKNIINIVGIEQETEKNVWYKVITKNYNDDEALFQFQDITEYLYNLAENQFDYLTGLLNNRELYSRIDNCIKESPNQEITAIVCDVDYFKQINDTYGHTFGDIILRTVAEILKKIENENNIVARYGGDEFIIISVNQNRDLIKELMELLTINVEQSKVLVGDNNIGVTISSGMATMRINNLDDFRELVKYADEALYLAKEKGRNQVISYNEKNDKKIQKEIF